MSTTVADSREPKRSPGRPRTGQPSVTRDAIGTATANLLRAQGPSVLTMSRVAKELGVRSQSLYHHVRSLDDLIDAARGVTVRRIDLAPLENTVPFREGVQQFALEYLRAFLPFTQSIWTFFQYPIADPATVTMYETFMRRAIAAGLPEDRALTLMLDVEYAACLTVFEHAYLKDILPLDDLERLDAPTLRSALAQISPDTWEGSSRRLAERVGELVDTATRT